MPEGESAGLALVLQQLPLPGTALARDFHLVICTFQEEHHKNRW